jgi:hypothetical protein
MSLIVIESEIPKVINEGSIYDTSKIRIVKSENLDNGDVLHHLSAPISIDLRTAITSNASKIQIRTLKNNFNNLSYASQVFPTYENINELNSWALSQNETAVLDSILNLEEQTINIFDVDFTNLINNEVAGKINQLSDEEAFGTRTSVVTQEAIPGNQNERNITINLNDIYAGATSLLTFEQSSELMYYYGLDPASAFVESEDELSFKKVKHGLMKNSYSKPRQKNQVKKIFASIRGAFSNLGAPSEVVQVNTDNDSNSIIDFRTFEIEESLRYSDINFNFSIKQSDIDSTGGKIYLVALTLDSNNLFLESLPIDFVFTSAVETSGLNLFYPDLKVSARRTGVNKNIPCVSIKNNGVIPVRASVYAKVTRECQSRITTDFQKFATITLSQGETRNVYGTGINDSYNLSDNTGRTSQTDFPIIPSGGSVFFRVIAEPFRRTLGVSPVRLQNTFYAQLESPVLESNVFIPITPQIFNQDVLSPYILLQIDKPPLNAKSLIILKRNLTKKERKFRQLTGQQGLVVDSIVGPFGNNKTLLFPDYDVKNDNVYEYKVFVDYSNSKKISSINSCIVEFVERKNIIELAIVENEIESSVGGRYTQNITLNVSETRTDAERLFDDLPGDLYDLYAEDLNEIRSAIGSTKKIKIFRYDRVYGEHVKVDDASVVNLNPSLGNSGIQEVSFVSQNLRKGGKYLYEIQPYVMNSSQIASLLRNRLIALSTTGAFDPSIKQRIRALILKLDEESSVGGKYSTRSAILRGTIETPDSAVQKSGGDFYADGKTGDFFYVEATMPTHNVTIQNQSIALREIITKDRISGNVLNRNVVPKAPLLKFTVSGDINFIDYFVLISEKNGVRSIVGSAHHVKDNSEINYFDVSQLDYQGAINYYVSPVFEDGSIGETSFIGNTILSGRD